MSFAKGGVKETTDTLEQPAKKMVSFAASPLFCIEEDDQSECSSSSLSSSSSSSEGVTDSRTKVKEQLQATETEPPKEATSAVPEAVIPERDKEDDDGTQNRTAAKRRRKSSLKSQKFDSRRRRSQVEAKKVTKPITTKIDTGRKPSLKSEQPDEVPVIPCSFPCPGKTNAQSESPKLSTFSTVSEIPQRMHRRMEDLVSDALKANLDRPQTEKQSSGLGKKAYRASRIWQKQVAGWERKKVPSNSDESSSTWSASDSEEEDFALTKVPLRKTRSCLYEPQIVGVLHRLQLMKKKRKKKDIHDQIKEINNRIQQALKNVGMEDRSSDEEVEGEDEETKLPYIFPGAIKRQEMKRQAAVIENISKYSEDCDHRLQLIHDVDCWIGDPTNLVDGLVADDDLENAVLQFMAIHRNVMEAVNHFGGATEKVVVLGNQLLKEASLIIKEHEENLKKQQAEAIETSVVYDERALLADSVKWDNAVKMIIQTFNDAVRWTKNSNHKYVYGKGQKQFKNLSTAMKTKDMELKEKRKNVEDLKAKMNMSKATAEKQAKEMDEIKKSVRKMSVEIEEKKRLLTQAEEKNKVLVKKLAGVESKMKTLECEIETRIVEKTVVVTETADTPSKQKKKPPPQAPPPTPEVIKVVDSSTQLKLDETEAKLSEAEARVERLKERLRELEKKYKFEQEKVNNLKVELVQAEKAAEEAMEFMQDPVVVPELPQETAEMEKDAGYYKTLLTGMRRDFNTEVEKLKGYLKKERARNTAVVRRVEINHKDHLHAIQKDILRVLRAIIHFRDHVVTILEKENLKEPAFSLQQLPSLIPEKLIPDPKELLTLLVGNVVEYMHNMELTLANAFLAMRMVVKGAVEAAAASGPQQRLLARQRSEERVAAEQHKTRIKKMESAKMETQHLARRLKKAKDRLQKFEEISELTTTDKKYIALLERYRMVWKMYNKLQKDMDVLQVDFQTTVEEKLQEKEDLMVTQMKIDLKESKKVHEKELKLSIADQRRNLKLLEKAYEENKISKELYDMSASLLRKAMEVPRKRLQYLIEQYVAFKTVKSTKERVEEILADKTISGDLRRDIIRYMRKIDEKFHMSMTMWHDQMKILENERRMLFRSIWKKFTEVVAETGMLLIHPLFQDSKDKFTLFDRLARTMNRDKLKELMKKKKTAVNFTQLPDSLAGFNVLNPHPKPKHWIKDFSQHGSPEPAVNTPHIVEYDVNKPKIEAKRKLARLRRQQFFPMSSIQNYTISREQQIEVV